MTDAKIFFEGARKPRADQGGKVFPAQQNFQAFAAGSAADAGVDDGQVLAVEPAAKTLNAFAGVVSRALKPRHEVRALRGQGKGDRNHLPSSSRSRGRSRFADADLKNRS